MVQPKSRTADPHLLFDFRALLSLPLSARRSFSCTVSGRSTSYVLPRADRASSRVTFCRSGRFGIYSRKIRCARQAQRSIFIGKAIFVGNCGCICSAGKPYNRCQSFTSSTDTPRYAAIPYAHHTKMLPIFRQVPARHQERIAIRQDQCADLRPVANVLDTCAGRPSAPR